MMMIPKWGNYPGDGGGGITLVIDTFSCEIVAIFSRRRKLTRSCAL